MQLYGAVTANWLKKQDEFYRPYNKQRMEGAPTATFECGIVVSRDTEDIKHCVNRSKDTEFITQCRLLTKPPHNNHERIKEMLKTITPEELNTPDRRGLTPLMLALKSQNQHLIYLLLEMEGPRDGPPDENGDATLGAPDARAHQNLNAKSKSGFTPLMFAAWKGDKDAVATLLRRGANPHLSISNRTAWHIAFDNDHYDVRPAPPPAPSAHAPAPRSPRPAAGRRRSWSC